jgi:hypothetical protein
MRLKELFSEGLSPQEKAQKMSDYDAKKKALQDIQLDPNTAKDPDLKKELARRKKQLELTKESATAGATSSANIGTVVSPHLAIGKDRGNKSYTGSPGKSGTKAPRLPKIAQKKKSDGTAVNALDIKGNIFGGGQTVKR